MDAQITINIVFIRDTVNILAWFVRSLEAHATACRFRIISNGCSETENQILHELCAGNDRLEFLIVSQDVVLEHGIVLRQLQQQERSPYFAFMDSDILAVGPFLPELLQHLSTASAVYSCAPVWSNDELNKMPAGYQYLSGQYSWLSDGFCSGNTYFAIYHNDVLSRCMHETGITFRKYKWNEIQPDIQEELRTVGMDLWQYDTAKLLNIMLGLRAVQGMYVESTHLWHVGGISCLASHSKHQLWRSIKRRLLQKIGLRNDWDEYADDRERDHQKLKMVRKDCVTSYLTTFLESLTAGEPWTESFVDDDLELVRKIRHFERELRQAFAAYQSNRRLQAA